MAKRKKSERQKLIESIDPLWSRYIRSKYADDERNAQCYTCGKRAHVLDLQAGHFMSRRYHATRYDYDNTRVQCYSCNVGLHGNQYRFGVRLDEEREGKASSVAARSKDKPPSIDHLKQLRAVLKLSLQRLPEDYWIRPRGTAADSPADN